MADDDLIPPVVAMYMVQTETTVPPSWQPPPIVPVQPQEPHQGVWASAAVLLKQLEEAAEKHPTVSRSTLIGVMVAAAREDLIEVARLITEAQGDTL